MLVAKCKTYAGDLVYGSCVRIALTRIFKERDINRLIGTFEASG